MERDCQTIPTISDNGFEDNLDNWEQLFQGAGWTTPPGAKRAKGRLGSERMVNIENRFADMETWEESGCPVETRAVPLWATEKWLVRMAGSG